MTNRKKTFIYVITLCFVIVAFATPRLSQAASFKPYEKGWQLLPDCALDSDQLCTLDDFVQGFINVAQVGLRILPYIALLMMVWAGFNLIIAGGNPEKVQEGKRMITSVLLGIIIIIFLAWTWTFAVVTLLTGNSVGATAGYVLGKPWWGGGTAHTPSADLGCCHVYNMGCSEKVSESKCKELTVIYSGTFMGPGSACPDNPCKNYANGCCRPTDITLTGQCHTPSSINGCIDYPNYLLDQSQSCVEIAQCHGTSVGCCVPTAPPDDPAMWQSCSTPVSRGVCPAGTSFQDGLNCYDFPICKPGCCVPKCSVAWDRASQYWCEQGGGHQTYGDNTFRLGSCNNSELNVGCCVLENAPGFDMCYFADGPRAYNRQRCNDAGGVWDDDVTCAGSIPTPCRTGVPLTDPLCGIP